MSPSSGSTTKLMKSLAMAVGLLSATLLVACGSSGTESGTKSEITFARAADVITLDPNAASENTSIWTDQLLYATLVESTPDGKSTRPALAEEVTRSDDGLSWEFRLKPGLKFSDGSPLTSKDVIFSLKRNMDPAAPWGFLMEAVKSVTAKGDDLVVVETKYPYAPLLADLSLFANAILPADFGGKSEKSFFADPVSSGPYQLDTWERGRRIVLEANPQWHGPKSTIEKINFTNVANDNTRVLQLKGGQADIIEAPPLSQVESLSTSSGVTAETFPSTYARFLTINQKKEPFQDIHVRKAMWHALDREAIVKAVLFEQGTPANSFFSDRLPYYDPETPELDFDLTAARAEMAKSSVPDGFSTTLLVGSGDSTENSLAQVIQAALGELNIDVRLKSVEVTDEFPEYLAKGKFDLGLNYYTSDIPDPDEIVSFMLDSEFLVGYDNPELTKLGTDAARTLESDQRQKLYSEFQRIFAENAVWAPLYYAPYAYGLSDQMEGFSVSPLGTYSFEGIGSGE